MAITAAMVKELREMTGAGMMDCKKALTNTDGDMDAAVEHRHDTEKEQPQESRYQHYVIMFHKPFNVHE